MMKEVPSYVTLDTPLIGEKLDCQRGPCFLELKEGGTFLDRLLLMNRTADSLMTLQQQQHKH